MTQICLAVLDQAKFQNTVEEVHSVLVGWVLVETSELFVVFSICPKNIQSTDKKKYYYSLTVIKKKFSYTTK